MELNASRKQGRGRSRDRQRRNRATGDSFIQHPVQQYQLPFKPLDLVCAQTLETLHQASLKVLREHGMAFTLPQARAMLKRAGAHVVEGEPVVRFDPEMIMEKVAQAPSDFKIHGRKAEDFLTCGGPHINFSTLSSPPNATDLAGGRRPGNYQDFRNFLKLTHQINVAQVIAGYPVEPLDIAVPIRHLYTSRAILTMTEKPLRVYSHNRKRIRDVMQMVRIAHQLDDRDLIAQPRVFGSINPNSPRQYDDAMLIGIIECAKLGQPLIITPFTLAGAMAPVSLAGALTLQNAEALAGIAFAQIVRPGTPVMYGSFTSNIDMRSGAPAFGTPESAKCIIISGQLARRYNLPYRSSNANAANAPDAQAVYESQMSLWASLLSQSNFVFHGLGWLEGGLAASFEKFIIDAEMIQGLMEFIRPIDFSPAELALDAIGGVAPAGHYLGSAHTMQRYQTAFYTPFLSDWQNFEAWQQAGSLDATRRAEKIYRSLLDSYEQPVMDDAVGEELDAFVEKREAEGGSPVQ